MQLKFFTLNFSFKSPPLGNGFLLMVPPPTPFIIEDDGINMKCLELFESKSPYSSTSSKLLTHTIGLFRKIIVILHLHDTRLNNILCMDRWFV